MRINHKSTRQAKIDWLLKNEHLWEGYAEGLDSPTPRKRTIVLAMKEAGLVARSTYWPDISLYNLVIEARKQRAGHKEITHAAVDDRSDLC